MKRCSIALRNPWKTLEIRGVPGSRWIDRRGSRPRLVTDQILRITYYRPTATRRALSRRHQWRSRHRWRQRCNLYLAELPPQQITKLERLD